MLIKYQLSNYCLAVIFHITQESTHDIGGSEVGQVKLKFKEILNSGGIQTQVQGDLQIFRAESTHNQGDLQRRLAFTHDSQSSSKLPRQFKINPKQN